MSDSKPKVTICPPQPKPRSKWTGGRYADLRAKPDRRDKHRKGKSGRIRPKDVPTEADMLEAGRLYDIGYRHNGKGRLQLIGWPGPQVSGNVVKALIEWTKAYRGGRRPGAAPLVRPGIQDSGQPSVTGDTGSAPHGTDQSDTTSSSGKPED